MSDGKRETVEDIVEEMRDATMNGEFDDATVNDYADRIEAAWRRDEERAIEHATSHAEAVARDNCRDCIHNPNGKNYEHVGNAAAMRDALESVRNWCINKLGGASFQVAVEGLLQIVDKAMTAPARNCDRFADETDAQIAFLNEVWLISVTKETALEQDRFENWTDEMRSSYAKWLFAPAAERKGGGDGR